MGRLTAEQQELVINHTNETSRYVRSRLRHMRDTEDLQATAQLKLCELASRYDASLGVPFFVFVRHRLHGLVDDYVRELAGRVQKRSQKERVHAELDLIPGDGPDAIERSVLIAHLMRRLTEMERRVITAYFLEGQEQKEISERLHISQSRVSQLLKAGLIRLGKPVVKEAPRAMAAAA